MLTRVTRLSGTTSQWVAIWADTVHTYVAGLVGPNASFSTTPGAFQTARPNPSGFDTFVYEESSTGVYSTYLGGSNGSTMPTAIAVISGHVYVAGNTSSSAFPARRHSHPIRHAGWVSKLKPQLNALDYTTLLGASINGIALQQHTLRYTVYTAGYRFTGAVTPAAEDAFVVTLNEPVIQPVIQ